MVRAARGPKARPGKQPAKPGASQTKRGGKKSNTGLLLLATALGVIALVLVGGLIATLLRGAGLSGGAAASGTSKPASAAKEFLNAIAAGDASRALQLQQATPANTVMLTNQVLAASRGLGAITNIHVIDPPKDSNTVDVSYRMGQKDVNAKFGVVRQADGSWKLDRGTTTLQVTRPKTLPVLLNGVKLETSEVEVFPGTYRVETGIGYLGYDNDTLSVVGPLAYPRIAPIPRLTADGESAFLDAAREALSNCMRQKSLAPADCPQNVATSPDQVVDTNSIQWTLINDPWGAAQPKLSIADESQAEVALKLQTHLRVNVRMGKVAGETNQLIEFDTTARGGVADEPMTIRFGE